MVSQRDDGNSAQGIVNKIHHHDMALYMHEYWTSMIIIRVTVDTLVDTTRQSNMGPLSMASLMWMLVVFSATLSQGQGEDAGS